MSEVDPVRGTASSATLRECARQSPTRANGTAAGSTVLQDRVEISELAALLSRLAELPEDRARKVVEIRRAIADGTYETPEKLDIALDRFMEDLTAAS